MAISVGQTSQGVVVNSAAATSCTTAAVTTSVSGSGFEVGVFQQSVGASGNFMPVTVPPDSKGNTYTHIGTQVNNTGTIALDRFYCDSGTGGAGHTVMAQTTNNYSGTATGGTTTTLIDTGASWTVNQWANYHGIVATSGDTFVVSSNTSNTLTFSSAIGTAPSSGNSFTIGVASWNIFLCEGVNQQTSSSLDQSNTGGGFAASPYGVSVTPTSGDLTNGELVISFFADDFNGGTALVACAGGFTLQQSYNAAGSFGYGVTSGMATQIVTTTGARTPSWIDRSGGGGAQNYVSSTDSFIGAASGSNTTITPTIGSETLAGIAPALVRGTVLIPITA